MSAPVLGIDFGTTNTAAAFFDKAGKLKLVPVSEKSFVLPSVVWFHAADKALVGHAARTQIIDDPRHTLFGIKRFLGRRYQSEFVTQHKDRFAFELMEGADGYCAVSIYGQVRSLMSVAQFVIKQILTLANHAAGAPFKECVLTVPAHASVRQREAVRQAAQGLGLTVRAIVNEPTAAALYYANLRNPEQTVLVFDLGGGTFDATVLSVRNRVVQVRATGGDAFLGGANFDEALAEHLAADFQREHGIDLRKNKVVMQRLIFAAESAKIALSKAEQTQVRIPCISQKDGQFIDLQKVLTRKESEQVLFQLIERTASACDDVLQRAGLAVGDVEELVLVGGQTRMPAIRERVAHFKRFSSEKDIHPELGVAIGAAILGRNLARQGGSGLADVVPMPLSVMLPGGATREVIAANSPVPCTRTVVLEGLPAWNAPVPVALFESLDTTSVDREILGTVQVGPEWRVGAGGPPSLELQVGQDFSLKARLVAPNGHKAEVPLVDPRPQART
ncbi:Hsp70 family protein [Myxococcaceae bacterium GXIMD 01537]